LLLFFRPAENVSSCSGFRRLRTCAVSIGPGLAAPLQVQTSCQASCRPPEVMILRQACIMASGSSPNKKAAFIPFGTKAAASALPPKLTVLLNLSTHFAHHYARPD
ncbi:MAG: hypothetical protein SPL54_06750, partial [Lachnospiraceae bacterium]|nr:hypothetical protein [Lachnospiraceae bacterium]